MPTLRATLRTLAGLFALAVMCLSGVAYAQPPGVKPGEAGRPSSAEMNSPAGNEIDVDEHLGEYLDLNLDFVDHLGNEVVLSDYFDGERPVLLTLNYYRCPVLCNVQLNALTESLRELEWTPGDEHFRVVTVSIDPRETAELAKEKRASHLSSLGKGDDVEWAFLTGDALDIRLLAAQVGFGYAYDKEQDQYAHAPVLMFISPDGKIARYVYGLAYNPRDIKFGLIDAAEGKVGTTVDKVILSCFHYDPTLGRYGAFAFGMMRLGGVAVLVILGAVLFLLWRRNERRRVGVAT